MPYTFTLTATIPASPEEIYEAWLDSLGHSEMTFGEANMSGQVGAEVSAWDGYISGRNLELIPGERIVQSWRTTEFADEHEDSVISIVLTEVGDGTLLTLEHSNVPDDKRSYEEGGWQSHYFEPMVAYFTGLRRAIPAEPRKKSGQQSTPKAPPKRAAKRPAKAAVKTKPAAKAKSQRAASPAKAAKKKIKHNAKTRRPAPKSRKKAAPRAHKTTRRKRR
ncbi:MAG: SRPBCC domain-containing protein [Xanthobacteraceae bacterium]